MRRICGNEAGTPCRRVPESGDVSGELNERLRKRKAALNVVSLQRAPDTALKNPDRLTQNNHGSLPEAHGQVFT